MQGVSGLALRAACGCAGAAHATPRVRITPTSEGNPIKPWKRSAGETVFSVGELRGEAAAYRDSSVPANLIRLKVTARCNTKVDEANR